MSKLSLKFMFFVLFSLLLINAKAENNIDKNVHYPFAKGENFNCVVYYNWGPLWIKAGYINFKTTLTKYNKTDVFHFEATGKSSEKWNWLFTIDDYYQTYVFKNNLLPLYYEKHTIEGGSEIHNRYFFNYKNQTLRTITMQTRKPEQDTTIKLPQNLYDVLSAVYKLRLVNSNSLKKDDTIGMNVILNGKIFIQKLIFAGKVIATNNNDTLILTKYDAVLSKSNFFSKNSAVKVYVTDDKNRYPVYIEAEIVIGSIKSFLTGYEDIKIEQ